MPVHAKLSSHIQFLPRSDYANFGTKKYPTFAAMREDLAWLLGCDPEDIREIDNSDHDGADDQLAFDGRMIGSFWPCPFDVPDHWSNGRSVDAPVLAIAAE